MKCGEFRKQYAAFLDGPPNPALESEIEGHRDGCPACAAWADSMLSDLKELKPLLPRWCVTDAAWGRYMAGAASRRAFMAGYLWHFARVGAVAILLVIAGFLLRRTFTEKWEVARAEKILEVSSKTRILLSPGTEYRLSRGDNGEDLVLAMNRGEVVLGVEKGVFRSAGVDLPAARVRVVGTFFLVRTVGALDFTVEVLEGTVRIEAEGKALLLESGKSADKRKARLVVSPLAPTRENDLMAACLRLLGPAPRPETGKPPARPLPRPQGKAPAKQKSPEARLSVPAPEMGKDFFGKLREYQPAVDTACLLRNLGKPVEAAGEEEAPGKAWAPPEGKPYSVNEGVEIWRADTREPVRWYEELGEFEFKYGRTGLDVEAMAVRRASRMGASGFIVLSVGRMDSAMVSEIEFRRGQEQDLTVGDMDVREYGNIYDSKHFATRSKMRQDAFYLRVKFFRYY